MGASEAPTAAGSLQPQPSKIASFQLPISSPKAHHAGRKLDGQNGSSTFSPRRPCVPHEQLGSLGDKRCCALRPVMAAASAEAADGEIS